MTKLAGRVAADPLRQSDSAASVRGRIFRTESPGQVRLKECLVSAACGPSRRDALTIARSFNCGWRVANDTRPAGTAEPVRFETSKSKDHHELQSSRWDEFCVRPPHPQLKLRAIVKSAAGARPRQRFFRYQPPPGVHAPHARRAGALAQRVGGYLVKRPGGKPEPCKKNLSSTVVNCFTFDRASLVYT